LIVNADDFGHSHGVNQGIVKAHREGLVTSTTLMVLRPFAEHAARLAEGIRTLDVGLHVTLTGAPPGQRPALTASDVPSLVDSKGYLPRNPSGLANASADQVEREILAQLAHFEELIGRAPSHLDSHHHSHRQPPVLEAIIRVARERSLPVRNASPEVAAELRQRGVVTTGYFVEEFFDEAVNVDDLLRLLANLPDGTTELMCHPGYVDDTLRRGSTYVAPRERELRSLCSPVVMEAAERGSIERIRWRDLVV
jgi:predicted glycoside hydrolase/deacetylase ChbG (UPF0249 family)